MYNMCTKAHEHWHGALQCVLGWVLTLLEVLRLNIGGFGLRHSLNYVSDLVRGKLLWKLPRVMSCT